MKRVAILVQGPAEIMKHFKILVTRFSVRVSWRTCVLIKAVNGVELFIRTGSVTELQRGFRHETRQHAAPSSNAIRRWVR